MKPYLPLLLIMFGSLLPAAQFASAAQTDAHMQVAAALYSASVTQIAAEKGTDIRMTMRRKEIDNLRARMRRGEAPLSSELAAAQEEYVAALAAYDHAYAQEIAVFRNTVESIASTPEGTVALTRFNEGDEIGALGTLDDLTAAWKAAGKKQADNELAANRREMAILAKEARSKGKLKIAQVIARFEEVTQLDASVHWDWIELSRLYKESGKLIDALYAAKAAAEVARNDGDRSGAFNEVGDIQVAQRDMPAALASYQTSLAISESLAQAEPGNTEWQRNLSISHKKVGEVREAQSDLLDALASYQASFVIVRKLALADPGNLEEWRGVAVSLIKIGDIQVAQEDLGAALSSYQASHAIFELLVQIDPGNENWQRNLSVSHNKIGDIQHIQGTLPAALASYQASFAIRKRLAQTDPDYAGWQRDLSASYMKIGDVHVAQGDLPVAMASYRASLAIAERLVQAYPDNAGWQRDLAISHVKIGDVQVDQNNLPAAMTSYRASLAISERLARAYPANVEWRRDLIVSYVKLSEVTGNKAYATNALDTVLAMQKRGVLTPRDTWMIEELKRRTVASE